MIDADILTELQRRLSAALPYGYSSSLYTNDGGAVVTVADLFDVEWGVPFFTLEVRGGREEIERAIDEAADATSERAIDTRRLSRRRIRDILGPHSGVPIGYAYDAFERAGLVALVASKILAWRPPRGVPVAVYVSRDTPEWRANVRAALRAVLPDVEPPPREVADATAEAAVTPGAPPEPGPEGPRAPGDDGGAPRADVRLDVAVPEFERGRRAGLIQAACIVRDEAERLRAPHDGPQERAVARMRGASALQRAAGLIDREAKR